LITTQIVIFVWRLLDPDILDVFSLASTIYFLMVLSLFVLVTINGWFGAAMTFPVEGE
ncbi:MAG: cytochrome b5, partial [Deltaproteobacteria bacterium]|nr:cytochrome b5 [Deltaproteobacteria bacterium]